MTTSANFSRGRPISLMAWLMMDVLLTLMDQTVVSTALPTTVGQPGGINLGSLGGAVANYCSSPYMRIVERLTALCGATCL